MAVHVAQRLVERGRELDRLEALLAAAGAGEGRALVLVGPSGIGKTELVEHAVALARARDMCVLRASGGELEQGFSGGVVRQLFEPALAALDAAERATVLAGSAARGASVVGGPAERPSEHGAAAAPAGQGPFGVLHGLFWLTANLTAVRGPVLVAVDDLHWADELSLHFCVYFARRLGGLPVAFLGATRSTEAAAEDDLLARLVDVRVVDTADLQPLSRVAVAAVVRERESADAGDRFCAACHEATGGNPFLLRELLASLRTDGIGCDDRDAPRIAGLGPNAIARAVLLRLGRLTPGAVAMARGLAVLSSGAELRHVAALAGLDRATALATIDALAAAEIVTPGPPPAFVHPIVRTAVSADLGAGERARLHGRAARLLAAEGRPPDEIAAHLLHADPAGDAALVQALRTAAAHALARGTPRAAAAYLERALREPPQSPGERTAVLFELGVATAPFDIASGMTELAAAFELAECDELRASIATHLARGRRLQVHDSHLLERVDAWLAALPEGEPERLLGADLLLLAPDRGGYLRRLQALAARGLDEQSAQGCRVLAHLAAEAFRGPDGTADETAALAERALAGDRLLLAETSESWEWGIATYALMFCDRFPEAAGSLAAAERDARARGAGLTYASVLATRAELRQREGDLGEAEEDAAHAERIAEAYAPDYWPWHLALTVRADVHRERGELDAAATLLERVEREDWPDYRWTIRLRRGALQLARGELGDGVATLLELGAEAGRHGGCNAAEIPWRTLAAPALARLGEQSRAGELIAAELESTARFGAPRAHGMALRAAGLVLPGDEGMARLHEATAVLANSGARLEYARALVDLGAALRRANRARDAREPLHDGLALAERCGAAALAERAREELAASGVRRVRRVLLAGVDSLTPTERRVASLAAEGLSNQEIAHTLFVAVKTVESHMTRALRKLGVSSRHELQDVLRAGD